MASTSQGNGGETAAGSSAGARAVAGPRGKKPKSLQDGPPALAEKPAGLPPGKYKLVGLELESTGRKLKDEIIQIAAYMPSGCFTQYIMPYGNLNKGARRRYKVRVVTVGRFRMLQDTTIHKAVKTKSEIAALVDFLNWLESVKGQNEKIILMYHEPLRLYPTLLIQSFVRHRLFHRFKTLVAGFTDSYALCAETCRGTFKSVALSILTQLLLDEGTNLMDTALDRASAVYHIIEQLANQVGDYLDVGAGDEAAAFAGPSEDMLEVAREFARPVYTEVEAFEALKDLLQKQNTLRSAFAPLLRSPRTDRRYLTQLRRCLADAGLLYEQIKDAWHDGRRAGLQNLFIPLEQTLSPEDIEQLVDLFDKHFILRKKPAVVTEYFSFTDDSEGPLTDSDSSGVVIEGEVNVY